MYNCFNELDGIVSKQQFEIVALLMSFVTSAIC